VNNLQALLQQAKAQAAANRFAALIRQSNAKVLDKIRTK
jgi:hypothetical protein